jgi:hypothetical protein
LSVFMEAPKLEATALPGKLDIETKRRRLSQAEARLRAAGIYCSTDSGELNKELCRRINARQ